MKHVTVYSMHHLFVHPSIRHRGQGEEEGGKGHSKSPRLYLLCSSLEYLRLSSSVSKTFQRS